MLFFRIKQFFRISFLKTIYVNFRMLPFKEAIRVPVFVYRRTEIGRMSGKILLKVPPRTGLVSFGFSFSDFVSQYSWGQINIEGTLEVGGKVQFGNGNQIRIYKNAVLSVGNNVRIMDGTVLLCEENVSIGRNVRIVQCQVMDTAHHYVENVVTKVVGKCSSPIIIGNDNWIASRCIVQKGTVTPDFCIVAAGSILNKDYLNTCPTYSLIAGCPAKLVKTGVRRIFCMEEERKWDAFYGRVPHAL